MDKWLIIGGCFFLALVFAMAFQDEHQKTKRFEACLYWTCADSRLGKDCAAVCAKETK